MVGGLSEGVHGRLSKERHNLGGYFRYSLSWWQGGGDGRSFILAL